MTEKIIKLWNEGTSLGTIAKRLNMTVETASWLLVKAMVWKQY
jgi:orotate phosphoribosyltransferase-like protein